MEPIFLSLEEVIAIHADQIERYGGSLGIRELSLLQSAIAMPEATFAGQYLHTNVFEMAAAYLYHLVQNHAFVDGNKRVGLAVALVFLRMNGIEVTVTNESLVETVLAVAQGKKGKADVTTFLRRHASNE